MSETPMCASDDSQADTSHWRLLSVFDPFQCEHAISPLSAPEDKYFHRLPFLPCAHIGLYFLFYVLV